MLHLVMKSISSMSSDIYIDNIFSTRYDLMYLKAWKISFLSASAKKVVQNLTLILLLTWKY